MSARYSNLTAPQLTELKSESVRPVYFVQLDIDVTQRWCTALESLPWNGHTWLGLGKFAKVSLLKESSEIQIQSIELGLEGIPVEFIALTEGYQVQNRLCTVWLGLFGTNYKLLDQPIVEYKGRINTPHTTENSPGADGIARNSISISVENRLAFGTRARIRRRTDVDHQRTYPGDTIFRFIGGFQNLDGWGRGR